jgi:hypothetical protein
MKETAEKFETRWAEADGLTLEQVHDLGLRAEKCDCGQFSCTGWLMNMSPKHPVRPPSSRK